MHAATSYGYIGTIYECQGRYEKALVQYRKAQEVYVAVYGDMHLSVADNKYNMAPVHKIRGETEAAKKLYLECEAIYAKVHGPDHSKTSDAAEQARKCA